MPFVIPGGAMQVTMNFTSPTFATGRAATVFGLTGDTDDLGTVVIAVRDAFFDNLGVTMHEAINLESIVVNTDARGETAVLNHAGERTGALAPPNVCILYKLVTGFRGAANRGRNYWPGQLNDGDINDDGTIDDARWTDLNATVANFFEAITTAEYSIVILHRDGSTPTPINGGGLERKVATQRRRLR